MPARVDCIVAGAGAVGLAVARALAEAGREVFVLEHASAIGTGTSSRNSEVIHAGIYYPTGSLKARLCVAGKVTLYRYLAERDIPHRRVGKLIVATAEAEVPVLERYYAQAAANGVDDLQWLDVEQLAELEPEVRGVRALLSPSTGILDTHQYMLALLGDLEAAGGQLACNTTVARVQPVDGGLRVVCAGRERTVLDCGIFINAAGLHAPALARRVSGLAPASAPSGWFAKGHYYTLGGKAPFKRLVYPVADRGSLGIHLTLDLAGAARFGPDLSWVEGEDYAFDDSRRRAFVRAIRRYYPGLDETRLQPGYTGIRPKLVGPDAPPADFRIDGPEEHGIPGLVNLLGIESPGITASLAIGDRVAGSLVH